ncbi:MAG: hypothetical protein ACTTJS_06340 [Wolinella sp.]
MEINIKQAMHDALYNKTEAQKRLSTPASLDDYFKKQQMTERAIRELENGGGVSDEVKKYVDVAALKQSLEESKRAGNNEGVKAGELLGSSESKATKEQLKETSKALSALSMNINDRFEKSPPPDATIVAMEEYEKASKKIKDLKLAQEKKGVNSAVENATKNLDLEPIKNRTIVNSTTISAPENAKSLANPLATTNTSATGVKFVDEYSQKEVVIPLDNDNAKKLIEKFGSLEEASDYVKGWYYEAAYGVGYLEHDSDSDGVISKEEAKNLKALVSLTSEKQNSYKSLNEALSSDDERNKFLDEFGFINSLAGFINHSIRQDSDTSGALSMKELVGEEHIESIALSIAEQKPLELFAFHRLLLGTKENGEQEIYASLMSLGAKGEIKSEESGLQNITEDNNKNPELQKDEVKTLQV